MIPVTQNETRDCENSRSDRGRYAPLWFVAGALCVIAGMQVLDRLEGGNTGLNDGRAWAQAITSGGARGVFAFSGQMTKSTYGVYVVDVDAMTIWAYEYQAPKDCMRLAAARTWRYDRYLENYNICDLPPDDVEQLIDAQRRGRLDEASGEGERGEQP